MYIHTCIHTYIHTYKHTYNEGMYVRKYVDIAMLFLSPLALNIYQCESLEVLELKIGKNHQISEWWCIFNNFFRV